VPHRRKPVRLLCVAAAALFGIGGVLVPGDGPAGATDAAPKTTPNSERRSGPKCGGIELTKATGEAWVCTFDEEFNGTRLNRTRWAPDLTSANGFHLGAACAVDTPRTISVSGGYLNLTVRRARRPFQCAMPRSSFASKWINGSVHTRKFAQAYGRISVRAKFPEAHGVAGLQSAIWTYPNSMTVNKALTGTREIDIAEAYSRWPDFVMPTVHNFIGGHTENCDMPDYGAAFHTFTVEWTPSRASFYYDGVLCSWAGRTGTTKPFLIALSQGLGIRNNTESTATPAPATMHVAWVRVWK
jgi:beta-glucanase (GH16 family)